MPHSITNGIVTFYEDIGEGPVVVLIHGHSADLRMWKYQIEDLVAAGYSVVRYDVRGHGRSAVPPAGYTWHNYAADLAGLLDHLNAARPGPPPHPHLVGCSMGGAIALACALQCPERVLSLTLVDSALPGFTYGAQVSDAIQALVAAVQEQGVASAFDRLWLTHPLFAGIRRYPDRFQELREVVLRYQAPEYREDYPGEGEYSHPDIASRLHEMGAPALVVVGENDIEDFQLIADILASTMPHARKAVIEDAWHLPSMEKPEEFNRLLIDFLRQTAARD